MDRNQAIELSRCYSREVKALYQPYKIVLYGSYSKEEQTKDSDIDIAVIFDGFSDDWLKVSRDLWEITEKANTVIEPVILDLQKDPSGFCKHVIETGIEL